ncbi:MAG: DUF4230 domain-containing protein, partial [Actinomycetota bacterium]|nr:DUF4230 domain-containing protein [Actinomycetota bacterium]
MLRERPRRSPIRTGFALGVAVLLVVAGFPLARGMADFLGSVGNPFRTEHTERAEPAVLTALADLEELHAATADLQVVVEIEDDTRYLPDFVSGRQTTFLAVGTVDAIVDLSGATVEEQPDGSVLVTLPAPRLGPPNLDSERSEVLDRDRGALQRFTDAVGEPGDDAPLYALAEDELLRA